MWINGLPSSAPTTFHFFIISLDNRLHKSYSLVVKKKKERNKKGETNEEMKSFYVHF